MSSDQQQLLRSLPKVDKVLARADVAALGLPRWAIVGAVRDAIEARRQAIVAGTWQTASSTGAASAIEIGADEIARRAAEAVRPSLRRVINATGVVLHTNLGRAPWAPEAIARVAEVARGYSNLEYDLDDRRRGSRHGHPVELLRALTGAEDAVVVNNCAGAVMLGLASLARGRSVVVSRGELIEIGGSFRVPEVMELSGARLVEVGTTNKTHARDYRAAVDDDTALLLKVHRSNFDVVGFTAEVSLAELVDLGREVGVPTMIDLGSGALLDRALMARAHMPPEPTVAEVVATGVDLAAFSGDKLLGGPQAGILVGRADAVERARTHPLMRALRPDKTCMAALEATLAVYRDGRHARDLPAVAMLTTDRAELRRRAERLVEALGDRPADHWLAVAVENVDSAVGGGAMPSAALPSVCVALEPRDPSQPGCSANAIDRKLRAREVPIIARIADGRVLLDVRTLSVGDRGRADDRDEIAEVAAALSGL